MKFAGLSLIAVAMWVSTSAWAQEATDSPYASIVARNMFGLVPIPVHNPEDDLPPADPPPKITPTGIMTIFGRDQALFRVANKPKPGQPAKEDAYVLSEGERQDGIEVVKINHAEGIITFNNHDTVQELPLVPAKDSGPSGAGPGPGMPNRGPGMPGVNIPRPGSRFPAPGAPAFFGGNPTPSMPNAAGGLNAANASGPNGLPTFGGNQGNANAGNQSAGADITPEQQVILMEAQRMQYMQSGNQKMANMIPPTPLTQQNVQENGTVPQ